MAVFQTSADVVEFAGHTWEQHQRLSEYDTHRVFMVRHVHHVRKGLSCQFGMAAAHHHMEATTQQAGGQALGEVPGAEDGHRGPGGHTSEILRLLECLSAAYTPRHYVIADSDKMSEEKICTFESSKPSDSESQFTLSRIPRSREVHQSWSSSVLSTLNALSYSLPLVFKLRPDVVLCNGPGTCIPLCVAGLLLGILGMKKVLIVYVESICRVQTLSLTGKILYPLSDYFFVQWPSLRDKYPKSIFLGRIV